MTESAFTNSLESLLAVATAKLDERGTLIEANAGFLRLVNLANNSQAGTHVGQFFIHPDFAMLIGAQPGCDGAVYQGLLTIADHRGQARTLRGRFWRDGAHLLLLAEHDIEDLERLNTTVLDLNRGYAQAQDELAQANLKLRATNTQLKETQKKLVEAEKMAALGVLLAGVAYEINIPLGVGLIAASTLQDKSNQLAERFAASRLTQSDLGHYLDAARTSTGLISQNLERIGHLIDAFRQVAVDGKSIAKRKFRLRNCWMTLFAAPRTGCLPSAFRCGSIVLPIWKSRVLPATGSAFFCQPDRQFAQARLQGPRARQYRYPCCPGGERERAAGGLPR
jgi:signal transduction histidine kinase